MKRLSVAIADDNPVDLLCLKKIIDNEIAYRLQYMASNGKELLYKIEKCNVDIIVLDLYMPFMCGMEVLSSLGQMKHESLILVCSNSVCTNDIEKVRLSGHMVSAIRARTVS